MNVDLYTDSTYTIAQKIRAALVDETEKYWYIGDGRFAFLHENGNVYQVSVETVYKA
jgi:hypothetical protein